MLQATIGDVLDSTIKHEAGFYIYLVRDGEVVFYIGQSFSIYDRLQSHLGLDWRKQRSVLGDCIHDNLPESRAWQVELYSLQDCEQVAMEHMKNAPWYSTEQYYNPNLIRGAVDLAEQAMIWLHNPCLNGTHNSHENPLPERYSHNTHVRPEDSSSMYLDL